MSGNEAAISAIDQSMEKIRELLRSAFFRSLAVVGRVSIPIILERGVFREEEVKGMLDEFQKFLLGIASTYSIGTIPEGNGICWNIPELHGILERIRDGVLEEVERLSGRAPVSVPDFDYGRAMDERGSRVGKTMGAGKGEREIDLCELSSQHVGRDIESLRGYSPSVPELEQDEGKGEQRARFQEIVNDPVQQAVSMENMERIVCGKSGGLYEPSDEELLLRMQKDSKGFAKMCQRFEERAMKMKERGERKRS